MVDLPEPDGPTMAVFPPGTGERLYHAALLFYHIRMKHAQNESHHLLAKPLLMAAPVLVH